MNLCFLCLSPRVSCLDLSWNWQVAEYPNIPPRKGEDCSVFLYFSKMFYEILSKIVASRAWRCALFRLASAKVGQIFELAKKPWIFFQKKFSFGCFACSSWQFKGLYRAYWAVYRVFLTLDIAVRAITIIVQQNKSAYWKRFSSWMLRKFQITYFVKRVSIYLSELDAGCITCSSNWIPYIYANFTL